MSLFTNSLAEQLQPLLQQPFQADTFTEKVLQPVFRGSQLTLLTPTARENLLLADMPEAAQQLARRVTRYGSVQTIDARTIHLYEVELHANVQPERNRAGLSALVRRLVAGNDAALATFASATPGPWRLSLVARDTVFHDGEFQNNDTPPKRFTFLLGPGAGGRTPAARLAALADGPALTMASVRAAFSVDTLTREFYRDLSNWYFWALPQIRFNTKLSGDEQAAHAAICTIKIITRIIFIWFLKEKRLVAPELFQRDELPRLLRSTAPADSTFYAGILQNLFFNVLNQKIPDRFRPRTTEVAQATLLFKDFDRARDYFNRSPFVNGGLFDGTTEECAHANPALDKLRIPNALFFGDSTADLSGTLHNPKAKKVPVHGLIDLLHRYQFTAEENTPLHQEVALDPELLGKIFENLLASYNEETQTTARKASGSFYTPREIVDYMVDESLLAYLQGQLPTAPDLPALLRPVLTYQTEEAPAALSGPATEAIIEALDRLTILDPTVGSGAFPMGILQKMTRLLQVLDPQNQRWLKRVLHRLPPALRYDMSERLQREDLDYVRKLGIIQQSIYGVDIQPIALQIAKLRFFISLIVEQRTNAAAADNFGVLPLPNLEFKFVCANTLVGLPKAVGFGGLFDNQELQKELADLRDQFFKSVGPKKREVEKAFKTKQTQLLGRVHDKHSRAYLLATWEPFKERSSSWFDAEWMFGVKDGFDLVIGNPPYVQLQKIKEASRLLAQQGYETYAATGDLYVLFYERGMSLLRPGGLLSFITSNKWMKSGYGSALRSYFDGSTNPLQLIDFAGVQVFEGVTVDTNILLAEKAANQQQTRACVIGSDFNSLTNLSLYFHQHALLAPTPPSGRSWIVLSPLETQIRRKIEAAGKPLKNWDVSIYRGILTGFNDAFIIDEAAKNDLIKKSPKSAEIIRPLLESTDLGRYCSKPVASWLLNIHNGQPTKKIRRVNIEKDYPQIHAHMLQFKAKLLARQDKGESWYNLRSCAYLNEFDKPKIIWGNLSTKPRFSIDTTRAQVIAPCNLLTSQVTDLRYLLAILNSKVCYFFMRYQGYSRDGGYLEYKKQFVEQIPIPEVSQKTREQLIGLIELVMHSRALGLSTAESEEAIDKIVYSAFGLGPQQIDYLNSWYAAS